MVRLGVVMAHAVAPSECLRHVLTQYCAEMKRKFNSLAMRFRKSGGAEPTQDPMQYRSLLVDGGDDDDDDDDEGATEVVLRADAPVTRHVGRGGARVSQV